MRSEEEIDAAMENVALAISTNDSDLAEHIQNFGIIAEAIAELKLRRNYRVRTVNENPSPH